ncbi:DNA cytosine methyltransferase [Prevotella histicola]|uniref:DNA cytosine methyltransferase n=1 Tax=Prevotella histicola TaxID=470565 RepID=UPI003C78BE8C
MNNIKLLYIDLFCGAGGTTTGVEQAELNGQACAKVIACVNHDANAIASHQANHPHTLHFTEDIRTLNLSNLITHLRKMKAEHPAALVVLWASLECTNFSKAKGGRPRDADSRTLADHLFRYIEKIDPDYIQIENVEEFMSWGDMDEKGHPISKLKGRSYIRWTNKVMSYGYNYDWRLLNSADYGAYTSRKRFFGQFAKKGLPIAFPVPTFSKNGDSGMFHAYKKWKPVREVLDINNAGQSIFDRKKPLCEKTLKRIYAGLIKFVAGGKDAFLVKYNSMNQSGKYVAPGLDEPCPTIACQNRLGVANVNFMSKAFSGDPYSKNQSIDVPAGTITTKDHHCFVTAYYGNGGNRSVESPCPTLTTKDRLGLISSRFLTNEYSGGGQLSSIDAPCPAVLTTPKQKVVDCFLMNPQFKSAGGDIDKPCFTLIARMDKMPPYLVNTEKGLGIRMFDTDSEMTLKIKEFMAMYGIIDIKMRMLNISELKRIMGFPKGYILVGTQAEQKKYIGNAVEVNMSKVLCEAICNRLMQKSIAI